MSEVNQIPAFKALEAINTNIMYADKDFTIRFINRKSEQTLNGIGNVFKQEFKMEVGDIVGSSIDVFHKNPAHQRRLLSDQRNFPISTRISFGGLFLELNVNPVIEDGKISGYILNWEDISEKVFSENEAQRYQQMVHLSPINTMIADPQGKLMYMNENSSKTLKKLEHFLPEKVDKLVGNSIDWFHKNPEKQRKIIKDPNNLPHQGVISVGDQKLSLLVSAISDKKNNYLGAMTTWEVVTGKLQLIEDLARCADELNKSAKSLNEVSSDLSASAEETSSQAQTSSTASDRVSAGVQTVATNMEEMTASIKEITRSTNESSRISQNAIKISGEANSIITKLGESSADIGNVVKVISSIAQQTNLLALNATIEAARAGDAGRGFAVVANEVKELAKQTAFSAQDITKKIEKIQGDTKLAIDSIQQVSKVIEQLSTIATSIAASVEEQAASTNEVSRVVQQSADAVKSISMNMSQVTTAASITGKCAMQAKEAVKSLDSLSSSLLSYVEKLKAQ